MKANRRKTGEGLDTGLVARVSIETLALATGLSERTVRKHLRLAERGGWIRRERLPDGTVQYRATLPAVHQDR